MKRKVIVLGGGDHAKVVINLLSKLNNTHIIGYTDFKETDIKIIPWIGRDEEITKYDQKTVLLVLGLGKIDTNDKRYEIFIKFREMGYKFMTVISPRATVNSNVHIKEGTVIMDGTVINVGTNIGYASIINTGAIVEHDCKLGDNVHIAPGAVVCGNVEIGSNTMVGANATIIQGVRIYRDVLIGAGSVVTKSILFPGVYKGIPAEKIK